ncbi:BrnT family toxin [Salinarimonas sp. NSM]|uniref:BrnT family toxin n=1 Tax=Salinarimonas sp. NSM TaxID=3458003 RepID=UPI00403539D5
MSTPDGFEWDDAKAASNEAKHGVSFDDAIEVFDDPARIEKPDDRKRYGEERLITFGVVDGVPLCVVYTVRGNVRRIISARAASRSERRDMLRPSGSTRHGDRP